MQLILRCIRKYKKRMGISMLLKLSATLVDLMLPYILEHMIDDVVPQKNTIMVFVWGIAMAAAAMLVRELNIQSNRNAVATASDCIYEVRHQLFQKTINLSGTEFDRFGLPSLISRMTSDSYNIQAFIAALQLRAVRSPITLIGGIAVTMIMDRALASILLVMMPLLMVIVFTVSKYGIPLYAKVQQSVDDIVRVLRENITGIRIVKALSKEDYESRRLQKVNHELTKNDIKASVIISMPSPIMQLFLNVGLTLVVFVGAKRVNSGQTQPGVILAFLTYFNIILQGIMGINRVFMEASKATASADRIEAVLACPNTMPVIQAETDPQYQQYHIAFEHVSFSYHAEKPFQTADGGEQPEMCLSDIQFRLKHGESLGIIGATGAGKTTVVNLLLRFYDAAEGRILIDGRDVRSFDKDELHKKIGVAFQNDIIFADTILENIRFRREIDEEHIRQAAEDARAAEFIQGLDGGYAHRAHIKGANLSGGQRQRILVSRALAGAPEILILDDASSALDYKTDAALRRAIRNHYSDTTTILIAQRISSVMSMDKILVLDNGRIVDYGKHEQLLTRCAEYREIYESQMGELA